MCKLGNIIVIDKFKNEEGNTVSHHSFIVIDDKQGYTEGLEYDFVSNMMCSFHNKEHERKKLKYKSNFPITKNQIVGKNINSKKGFTIWFR